MAQSGVSGKERGALYRLPVYRQLQQIFIGMIKTGAWRVNQALPNETHLASQYGVSVGTIRKVVDELTALGLVTRQQGRGTFVNDTVHRTSRGIFDPIRNADGSPVTWDPLRIEVGYGQANAAESERLGRQNARPEVLRLSWLCTSNNRVLGFQQSLVPLDLGVDKIRVPHLTGLAELYSRLGIIVERADEALAVSEPDVSVQDKLGLGNGSTLHASCRFFDDLGTVVGVSTLWLTLKTEYYACSRTLRSS